MSTAASAAAALLAALEPGNRLGIAVLDRELRTLAASPSLPALTGRPAGAERLAELLPEAIAEPVAAAFAALHSAAAPAQRDLRGLEADERTFRAACLRLGAGSAGAEFALALADTTGRTEQELGAAATREALATAEQLAGLGAYTWFPAEDRWSWSEQLFRLVGADPAGATPTIDAWFRTVVPEDREALSAAARDARAGRPVDVTFRQRRPDGSRRLLRTVAVPAREAGRIDGYVQDVTELERAGARQRVVAELGRDALGRLPLDELMRRATAAVADALDVERVTVVERRAGGAPVPRAVTGEPESLPVAGSAPIHGPGGEWGVLAAHSARPWAIGRDDLAFLRAVANVLGNAVERMRLEDELQAQAEARGRLVAQALDAEDVTRREIAETLHDGPLQDLLALRQEVARIQVSGERETMHLARAEAGLMRAIDALRDVMVELHPVLLDVGGLESALGAIAERQAALGGFEAAVRVAADAGGVRDELVLSLTRELLANAARHAHAAHVDVSVRRVNGDVVLEVADDGAGIPPGRLGAALREGHIGLASSRQRVEAAGGELRLSGGPGEGTRVTAVLPSPSPS